MSAVIDLAQNRSHSAFYEANTNSMNRLIVQTIVKFPILKFSGEIIYIALFYSKSKCNSLGLSHHRYVDDFATPAEWHFGLWRPQSQAMKRLPIYLHTKQKTCFFKRVCYKETVSYIFASILNSSSESWSSFDFALFNTPIHSKLVRLTGAAVN